MKDQMRYFLLVCYNLVQLFENGLSKPLRETGSYGEHLDGSGKGRFRRSIPELEAVNPLYTDYESLPDQEGSVDPQRAGFALTDHLSNIFRSQKSSKNNPKQSSKHASVDQAAASLTKDNSIDGEYLRADEQEECYKQQNIAPPAVKEASQKRCSGSGRRNIPEMVEKQRLSYIRGNLLKEKSGKHFEEKEGEKSEITSLYSHPEKVYKSKRLKHYPQPKTPEIFNINERVYKPSDSDAQFPIYDGDLDFHPDPLQGILDDKYWLDTQDQEAVIRKYMDVAANIVPSDLKISKRSDHTMQDRVQSKSGYKQSASVEEQCPCKQVVACGECSKGKGGKKTNTSGSYEDGISYGRKLLSIDYENNIEESRNDGAGEISSLEYQNVELPIKGHNEETQIDEHILSVTTNNDNKGGNIIDNNSISLGRKLLWITEFDESYDDIEDENEHYADRNNPELFIEKSNNDLKRNMYQYDELYPPASVYDGIDENPAHEHFLMAHMYPSDEQSKLYKSNKLANVLQKPLQKKPKGPPKKLPINTTLEFEALQNETLKNLTNIEQTTTPGQTIYIGEITTSLKTFARKQNKSYNKRWDDNRYHGYKGRRRHAEHQNTKKRLVALAQVGEDLGGVGTKETNKTSSTTVSMPPSVSSTLSQASNTTPAANSKNTSDSVVHHTPKKFIKPVEEGVEDARIATDIVNSVLSESQKSSVVGHNLGLCRRNESLMKVNYGKVIPETEKVLKTVTACIMDKLKNQLAKQSCIILDPELLDFLKWLILTGDSYKDYKRRLPKTYDFLPQTYSKTSSCAPSPTTLPLCDPGNTQPSVQAAISNVTPVAQGL